MSRLARRPIASALAQAFARKPPPLPVVIDPADIDFPDELDIVLRRLRELGPKPRFRVKAGSQRTEE